MPGRAASFAGTGPAVSRWRPPAGPRRIPASATAVARPPLRGRIRGMPAFEPRDPGREARVRASFPRQTVMTTIGARLGRVAPGAVEIELPFRADLCQQHGFLHAGIVTIIADSSCGYAALPPWGPPGGPRPCRRASDPDPRCQGDDDVGQLGHARAPASAGERGPGEREPARDEGGAAEPRDRAEPALAGQDEQGEGPREEDGAGAQE